MTERLLKNYDVLTPYWLIFNSKLDKEEAKEKFQWFLSVLSERITGLRRAAESNPPKVNFRADFTEESLLELEKWLEINATYRVLTSEEQQRADQTMDEGLRAALAKKGQKVAPESEESFTASARADSVVPTDTTQSLCFDVAVYGCEMVRRKYPDILYWDYLKKKDVRENYPILLSKDPRVFQVSLPLALVLGIAKRSRKPPVLLNWYHFQVATIEQSIK